jgi:hypothetical protein
MEFKTQKFTQLYGKFRRKFLRKCIPNKVKVEVTILLTAGLLLSRSVRLVRVGASSLASVRLSIVVRQLCIFTYICKSKSVPLQAWSGPEGSRKLRFPDYMTTAQDGGKVVSLTHRLTYVVILIRVMFIFSKHSFLLCSNWEHFPSTVKRPKLEAGTSHPTSVHITNKWRVPLLPYMLLRRA